MIGAILAQGLSVCAYTPSHPSLTRQLLRLFPPALTMDVTESSCLWPSVPGTSSGQTAVAAQSATSYGLAAAWGLLMLLLVFCCGVACGCGCYARWRMCQQAPADPPDAPQSKVDEKGTQEAAPATRSVVTQSQVVYQWWRSTPRFHPLTERSHGVWID